MYAVIVLAIALAFVLTIWFCWFALNLVLDTSRDTRIESARYIRNNLLFAAPLLTILAVILLVLRLRGTI